MNPPRRNTAAALLVALVLSSCGTSHPPEKSEAEKVCDARASDSLACFQAKALEARQQKMAKDLDDAGMLPKK